ncbi:DNA mismatch repair endonuclease MutL [Microaerobacter geothermalis]|uniref:DNA mismatch repair endonuclease MutL n=1 Tax=Microaerobacter geothermalis TaxID=674972 RepID=UPI001F3A30D3|nr:DNA mismatch repair endonuclease MutL [Microaerobacter geothermalis]MCF6093129.1 DNA mismatch repair endonuclease MutL [Microaerobacter geothermalis]
MGKITVLKDYLANQIAAGEVVERPSSVVKELVENAIDAGSTKIEIHIEEGGLSLIRVLDNGAGMDREDCEKSLLRHATSKIKNDKDLFHIKTLGFRGEALPSIAAVSRLTLKSRAADHDTGTFVYVEGGEIREIGTIGFPVGTEVTVKDLFFNTPARLKYLKTINTELGHISDYVNRLSLSATHISFLFNHNGRTLLRTNGDGKCLHVLASIYGTGMAKKMVPVFGETIDYQLEGFVSLPEITRANRSFITVIVNGRYIRSHHLYQAILHGYHTLLPMNRYPIVCLSIKMDPSLVDVNVHPSKLEVRFSKEKELASFISDRIQSSLHKQQLIPSYSMPEKKYQSVEVKKKYAPVEDQNIQIKDHKPEFVKSVVTTKEQNMPLTDQHLKQESVQESFPLDDLSIKLLKDESSNKDKTDNQQKVPPLTPLAQIHGSYIIAEGEDGLYLIDQHAAQERIYYEKFLRLLTDESFSSQLLLEPITLECTVQETSLLLERGSLLRKMGFDIEPFGHQSFIIKAHPSWLPEGKEAEIIEEVLEMIKDKKDPNLGNIREKSAIMMACKAAIKANQYLTKEEMEHLIKDLRQSRVPFTCPHGRPIIVHFSSYELKKMFKRVM